MAYKTFALDEWTAVTVYKRRTSRSLKLTVAADGTVKVSIPTWLPYRAGVDFARSRRAWITAQHRPPVVLQNNTAVGKAHHLHYEAAAVAKPSSRITGNRIVIRHPSDQAAESPAVQVIALSAYERALRQQAEELLPKRLAALAASHGIDYGSVTVKKLKSRWGSCDQHKNIVLNLYLMNLPWELIDYVLLHELAHTRVLRHGPDFWQEMKRLLPATNERRKALRQWQPLPQSAEQS